MGSISSDSMERGPYSSIPLEEEEEDDDEEEEKEEKAWLMRNKDGEDYYVDLVTEEREGVEWNSEFEPIEHPMEPLEEDQPAKCPNPMLDSSIHSVREISMMLSYFN
ncbi:proline-, glutamic acid- and leucine-rich protein 1 [Dendrobium catenatum]|uniref:Uncharacterized protein n=1 Tax=Dendrobium catenatum TaxID=906689 RepID=A0A2I0WXZ9_9ASPA|nr:proline-, glutamic acid- and leucine-rich protein 1 [Dendrobium catenatum]PKU80526.1 hypothetical protein MA16_Dca027011 [Dendrobium catenatum]